MDEDQKAHVLESHGIRTNRLQKPKHREVRRGKSFYEVMYLNSYFTFIVLVLEWKLAKYDGLKWISAKCDSYTALESRLLEN